MSLTSLKKNIREAVASTLESVGVDPKSADVSFGSCGRGHHPKITFEHGGERYTIGCPNTPSDHRAMLNWRSDLRRKIRSKAQ